MKELTGDAAPCSHVCYCARPGMLAELTKTREAKRMAGIIADQRSLENVALRTENDRLRAALRVNALRDHPYMSHAEVDEEIDRIVRGDEQDGHGNGK